MKKKLKIYTATSNYIDLYNKTLRSTSWKIYLKSLLLPYTHHYQQNGNIKFSKLNILKTILASCIFKSEARIHHNNDSKIFFWPFQFLHCDFILPLIEELDKKMISYEILVFRKDIQIYLTNFGVSSTHLSFSKRFVNPISIVRNIAEAIHSLFCIKKNINNKKNLSYILNSLIHISVINNARAAVNAVAKENSNQFHFIGYDMSIIGRAIIHELNSKQILSGRIQNGAPNYLVTGHSEAQVVFLWDKISQQAYLDGGYNGEVLIVGNILLHSKIDAGFNNLWIEKLPIRSETKRCKYHFIALSGPGHNTTIQSHIKTIDIIHSFIKATPQDFFIVKLHPKDSMEYYSNIKYISNVYFIDDIQLQKKPDALDLLYHCDILITGASTVVLDALSLGKQIISIDPFSELTHLLYLDHPNIIKLQSESEIIQVINLIKDAPSNKNNLKSGQSPIKKIISHLESKRII